MASLGSCGNAGGEACCAIESPETKAALTRRPELTDSLLEGRVSMKSRTPLTLAALLAVATISGCREGCCDPINGYPLPNGPPRASQVEFPDPTLTAGQSLTVSGVESLFRDDDPLTLTATSSDTTVVVVSMQGCSVVDPDPHDGCPSPAAFQPTDVSGVWSGMIRDAIPVRFELVQLSPTISAGNPAELWDRFNHDWRRGGDEWSSDRGHECSHLRNIR